MLEGALSAHVFALVIAVAVFSAFVLVASHRRNYRRSGQESVDPSGGLPGSFAESSDGQATPRFVKGDPVAYVSWQKGYGEPPLRFGTFLNFDKSGRARVDMGGYVVRRQPHLLNLA